MELATVIYESGDRVARITLDRPERGNGIVPRMPAEIAACVERANLDPEVHAIALAGNGSGFCGGYDLVASAEGMGEVRGGRGGVGGRAAGVDEAGTDRPESPLAGSPADPALGSPEPPPPGSPLDPATIAANHAPESNWDPVTDFQFMWRNVRGFMSLFHSEKPVLCKVHGYCVAGGTDMALCSDLLVVAEDAKIGYPPARVWGSPTTALWAARVGPMRAKRLLLTGDSLTGAQAAEWGLATEAAPPAELDERFEALLERVARLPVNQLVMMKMLVNQSLYAQGLHQTQLLGTFFDGIARHTEEGHEFVRRAAEGGFKRAVRERDEPFGDEGLGGFGVD
jgi:enoyl-CoA hydratase